MINAYDIAYSLGVAVACPLWAARKKSRVKVLSAFRERFGQMPRRAGERQAVWIHAVSLGEVNAARALVDQLLTARADLDLIVSTTTTTGHERATSLYKGSPRVSVVRYPLDFSAAITRALDALRPSVVVLMELETWPNFLRQCERRGIPVVLANGRITDHSFSRYRLIRPIVATMFRRLAAVCVQDAEYAKRFAALGAPPEKITITGTMKYDSAEVADTVAGADELQRALRLEQNELLWVCGSTGPGEEIIVLQIYRQLLTRFPQLRLAIIPRHPQRFDAVAALIENEHFPLLRRSTTLLPLPVPGERAGEMALEPEVTREAKNPSSLIPIHSEANTDPSCVEFTPKDGPLPNPLPGYKEREEVNQAAEIAPLVEDPLPCPLPGYREREEVNQAAEIAPLVEDSLSCPLPEYKQREDATAPAVLPSDSLAPRPASLVHSHAVLLGDTMGELRKFYSLATIVFVGRSLVDLGSRQHGSDMIEPAALGKPCIVGPFTGNFDQTIRALQAVDAIVQVKTADALDHAILRLFGDGPAADAMGRRAQAVVREQQGATELHLKIILQHLARNAV